MQNLSYCKEIVFFYLLLSFNLIQFINPTPAYTTDSKPATSKQCNTFTFDALKSYDPNNKKLEFYWDFGDGFSSNDAVIDHTYKNSGDYTVTLSVTDNSNLHCSTATTTQAVRVNFPPEAVLASQKKICVDDKITLDGRASFDDKQKKLEYAWDFGDETRTKGKSLIERKYDKPGEYLIKLAVSDQQETCNVGTTDQTVLVNAAPLAQAGDNEILKCVGENDPLTITLDASQSADPNNDDLTYQWEWGDGSTAEGIKVEHQYARLGTYDAKLIVSDPHQLMCSTDVDFIRIRFNKSPKAEAGKSMSICTGDEVTFDGSQSYVHRRGTATYHWDFGDGSSAQKVKTTHLYRSAGKYVATLTLKNELNKECPVSTDTTFVKVNTEPRAVLKVQPTGCVNTILEFDASGSIDPDKDSLQYFWDFGDGTVVPGKAKMTHTYKTGGIYEASVIVDDNQKTICSASETRAQILINTAPLINPGPNLTCCVKQNTEFDASKTIDPDDDDLLFIWDFGDGIKEEGAKTSHSYEKSGNYQIILTVNDQKNTACSEVSTTFDAEVNTSPIPIITVR